MKKQNLKMNRKYNFGAGPAAIPDEVVSEFAEACLEFNGSGISILELPHRSKRFIEIVDECSHLVKKLCELGDDYDIVWVQGGGRMQFGMIPMNFLTTAKTACYIDTGHWSQEAAEYARFYGKCSIPASSASSNYSSLPDWPEALPEDAAYLHFTTNNTIYGTQWHNIPGCSAPLIADMSSDILSGKHDYTKYDLFYAAAQKNLGTPGVSLVAIRKSFLESANKSLPPFFSFDSYAETNSLVNTANVSGVYMSLLMLRWIDKKGMENIAKENEEKASLLYETLDKSSLFQTRVSNKEHRSRTNVCFTASTEEVETNFLKLCTDNNVSGIAGHRYTGGFRVSLYNAVPLKHVQLLAELIQHFEQDHS